MDYQKIIDIYKQDQELRFLIMKLPYEYKLYDLYKSMVKQNIIIETTSVKELFENSVWIIRSRFSHSLSQRIDQLGMRTR